MDERNALRVYFIASEAGRAIYSGISRPFKDLNEAWGWTSLNRALKHYLTKNKYLRLSLGRMSYTNISLHPIYSHTFLV